MISNFSELYPSNLLEYKEMWTIISDLCESNQKLFDYVDSLHKRVFNLENICLSNEVRNVA
jgi:hypothetical protein